MQLRSIITAAAAVAFDVAGDTKEAATLHLGKTEAYDFNTDTAALSGGRDAPVLGVFYKDRQTQSQVSGSDASFMVHGVDAPEGIDEADSLTFTSGPHTGQKWNIYAVEPLSCEVGYILRIRL